tara:strand:- start:164 stop:676 length:513 start_codon:yes stop_codon:yes gene_type:complete
MVIWIIGKSGAGKTTIGNLVFKALKKKERNTIFLDGDEVRKIWGKNLGHSLNGRRLNANYIFRLCQMLDKQQINVVCCIVSIFPDLQKKARKAYKKFFLTYLKVPIKILKSSRDKKKIYKNYFFKKMKNVVGIDIPFPKPYKPDLIFNSYGKNTPLKIKNDICRKLKIND